MIVCPFCGLATESPHETQGACIAALHAEISRVRNIVDKLKEGAPGGATSVSPPTGKR